jgi:fatty-acyl-CoA synthase
MSNHLIERVPQAYDYPLLIKRLLQSPLSSCSRQEIVYRDRMRYDYLAFSQRVGQLANALEALGVKAGDTVAVIDWDSHRYLECFFAVPMMGATLHTINIRLAPEQILYTINHAQDDILLINKELLPIMEPLRAKLSSVKKYVLLKDDNHDADDDEVLGSSLGFAGEYEALLANQPSRRDFSDFDENTKATTFYTTGTTGPPKGVYFSHRQLVLHALGAVSALSGRGAFTTRDVYMPLTPMFHVHAWGLPYVATLLGVKQVYPGRYEPETILRLVQKENVTFSHCVPTILHMLIGSPLAKEVDLSKWTLNVGGSSLPISLCRAAMDLGINVIGGYGLSETCPILTLAFLKPHMRDWEADRQAELRCRAGLPLPLVDLKVVDGNNQELPRDGRSTGEVVVRAPWLTQGYLKQTERAEELWQDGWLHTGDMGFIDQEGYLQVTDRLKDVIKTGGEWISSLELEAVLTQHPAVSEVAVIGVPDDKWGERPVALVVLKEGSGGNISSEDLMKRFTESVAKGRIPKWGVPDKILFLDSLAKTSVGKINKRALRKQFGGRDS